METVEIVVFMAIAVLIGGTLLMALGGFDANGLHDNIRGIFNPEAPSFAKVDNVTLAPLLYRTWNECGYGELPNNSTFQYEGLPLNKTDIFNAIKRKNLCDTLSSAAEACGGREDLIMPPIIENGRIYEVYCDTASVPKHLVVR